MLGQGPRDEVEVHGVGGGSLGFFRRTPPGQNSGEKNDRQSVTRLSLRWPATTYVHVESVTGAYHCQQQADPISYDDTNIRQRVFYVLMQSLIELGGCG